ncbi:hypothetical protein [Sphingomonas xinjiangensis]|uniref:Uncharacterized protein n=1 Tax=Sphingomonas xinjiangensis TaxID=643568 RepID=A0A840YTD0_9SPHN|nr:hypothetical protein [Sphingomonas xinjiangensis]MBB5712883.1 hypothetical protein [Sphingomonas xinjiangensis]
MTETYGLTRELERVQRFAQDLSDPRSSAALSRYRRDLEVDLGKQQRGQVRQVMF